MIFSKFFKAKWQHKDSNVRITAINNELVSSNPEHKTILINLVQQDENELVRRTALIKLADFDTWLNESETNNQKKVKEYAQKQVTQVLTDKHEIKLSVEQKLNYIQSAKSLRGLETWLTSENNEKLIIGLFDKINKPQLLVSVFSQKQQASVQHHLLKQVTEKSQLEKLVKKACNNDIETEIINKITEIDRLLALPKAISKKAQLSLSKFLALTDVADYGIMLSKKEVLLNEWENIFSEFDCLTEQEREVFATKHTTIAAQLNKIFAPKAEAYQQQLISDKLTQERQEAKASFETEIAQIKQSLATSIFEHAEVDEAEFDVIFTKLTQQLSDSVLSPSEKSHFAKLIDSEKYKLTQLPIIAKSVSDATQLIAKISQLALPTNLDEFNERQPIYNDWLVQWRSIEKQASNVLPESICDAHKEIVVIWRTGLAPFIKEQKAQFTQAQKKIGELKRLISSGKYNIAFGVFKRVEKLVEQLSNDQKTRIEKEFTAVSEKMAELSDWEHYIATPRKQKLLNEIKALVETPLDNPNDQADKVKEYRKIWNSLGHADDEVERTLNNEFNECCEQAFAPCRLYYKEQEKIREQHLSVRLSVLEQVKSFSQSYALEPIDWKSIDVQLNKLQQQWQNAGEVERSKYKEIQSQYNDLIQPIKKLLRDYYDENLALKKSLIDNAKKALNSDDVFAAIQTVKDLQTQWKSIGYSGVKHENKLWKDFRTVNDSLFKKRDELSELNKAQQQTLFDQLYTQLDNLKEQIKTTDNINDLSISKISVQALLDETVAIKPINRKFVTKIETCLRSVESKQTEMKAKKNKQTWNNIFDVLEKIAKNDLNAEEIQASDSYNQVAASWQKRLSDVMNNTVSTDRLEDTLMLEIFAEQESPEAFKAERMQVQVKLMQEQMLSGTSVDLQAGFLSWLQKGSLTQNDLALIERIKPIYC